MKSGRPVLYELLKEQPRYRNGVESPNGHAQVHHHEPMVEPEPPAAEPPAKSGRLRAGSSIRLPVGYIFVGIAIVIVLAAGAYMFGFLQAQDEQPPGDIDEYLAQLEDDRIGSQLREPEGGSSTAGTAGSGPGRVASPRDDSGRADRGSRNSAANQPQQGQAATFGPTESDPRVSGMKYFRLLQASRAGAKSVADFCRVRGLEAYVVPANNLDVCYVYVLPGFSPDQQNSPEVKALTERIEEIRVLWRAETNRDDLRNPVAFVKR